MLEFLNIESTLKFLISTLFGSMIFFSVIIAPTVFKILDQKNSRKLIRNIFPKLYSWGILFSFAICILQIQTLNISFYLSLLMFLGFIFSKQILMPNINKFSDKKDEKKFKKLHTLSVVIFTIQLIILLYIF